MSSGNDKGRFDGDDKIIDITDYVNKQSTETEEVEMTNLTNHLIDIFNQGIIQKQKEEARKRFIIFMINFLLCTQIAVVIAICLIIIKIYS